MVYNFGAGPAMLPKSVLEIVQKELLNFDGTEMSIVEHSHRGKHFEKVHFQCIDNIKKLLSVPDNFEILLIPGGAAMQFAMIPMNMYKSKRLGYIATDYWSKRAAESARDVVGKTAVDYLWDGESMKYSHIPEYTYAGNWEYIHITTNNTIYGTQWHFTPKVDDNYLVGDMSSEIMTKPIDFTKFGIVYAGTQKTMGVSGLAVVIIRKDLIRADKTLPPMLSFKAHAEAKSLLNTPPMFQIYMAKLYTDWMLQIGGVAEMQKQAIARSSIIYKVMDANPTLYRGNAQPASRSTVNMTFNLPDEKVEAEFFKAVEAQGLVGLKGHRILGGSRVSMYTGMPLAGAEKLAAIMTEFAEKHTPKA